MLEPWCIEWNAGISPTVLGLLNTICVLGRSLSGDTRVKLY